MYATKNLPFRLLLLELPLEMVESIPIIRMMPQKKQLCMGLLITQLRGKLIVTTGNLSSSNQQKNIILECVSVYLMNFSWVLWKFVQFHGISVFLFPFSKPEFTPLKMVNC